MSGGGLVAVEDAPTVQRSRVLVVDDEPFNRDLLVQELEVYDTEVASTGEEALAMVAKSPPDLILLDVMMPGIDGYEVCRRLKGDDRTRFIPIVIMTALDAVEDRIRGIDAGADDFLTKPVDERELMARIRTALRAKHSLDKKLDIVAAADSRTRVPAVPDGIRACAKCGAVYALDLTKCMLDGAPLGSYDIEPLIGRKLDRYHIIERIGKGGMGCVYLASHATLKAQRYAIKVPFGELTVEREHASRFFREAEACAALDHPNIVSVLDFGTTPESLTYMVMEFVAGRTLHDIIQTEGPLAGPRAAAIARQMAAGLAHAHARGLVHRDVKPANVIVSVHDGIETVKLLDFGIVGSLSAKNDRLTKKDVRVGTPLYMAPEQLESSDIGPSSDLYALGVTLYEMLCREPPYAGDSIKMYADKLSGPPAPPGSATGLEDIAMALLQPDVKARPASAKDVIAAIDAAMSTARTSGPIAAAVMPAPTPPPTSLPTPVPVAASVPVTAPPTAATRVERMPPKSTPAAAAPAPGPPPPTPAPATPAPSVYRTVVLAIVVGAALFAGLIAYFIHHG
jgi:serine/threonine-protein kinase